MKHLFFLAFIILFSKINAIGQVNANFEKSKENKDLTQKISLLAKKSAPGTYLLSTYKSGYKVKLVLQKGSNYKYIVTTPSEETVPTVVLAKKTTCWDCWVDTQGNTNCFKIPCPKSVKPWSPGSGTRL